MSAEYEYACQEWWPEIGRWVIVGGGSGPRWQAEETFSDWREDAPERTLRLARRAVDPWEPVPAANECSALVPISE